MSADSSEDGMACSTLSPEEIELNRRAFPVAEHVVFKCNLNNSVGVNSPINNISKLSNDGKTSMPQDVSSEFSQISNSNPATLDGKTFMPQGEEEMRSPSSQQPVSNIFNSSIFGRISMPKNAFANPSFRTPEELEKFGLSHKFIVFKKGSPELPRGIINELNLLQVESENLVRLIPNQWTTIPGNNCVVFATFDSDFMEEEARIVVKFIESEFKKPFNVPANFAGMDSAGSTNTNTRSGIEVRFWFNRTTTVIDDLIASLTKLILKKDSLAGIFKCLKAPMVVARHFIKGAAGVAVQTIEQVFKFYGVVASCLTPESRVWGAHKSTGDNDITSAESWHVTLTYPSEGSRLPTGEFQIDVPTMDGSTTSMKVLFGFTYSKASEVSKPHIKNYKTILCTSYEAHGSCGKGASCTFAHGKEDRVDTNLIAKRAPLFNTKMCRSVQLGEKCFRHRCSYAHHVSELVPVGVQMAAPAQKPAAPSANISKESAPAVPQQEIADPKLVDIFKHGSVVAPDAAIVSRSMHELEGAVADEWVTVSTPSGRPLVPLQASSRACSTNYYEVLEDGPSVLPKFPIPIGILSNDHAVRSDAVVQSLLGVTPMESIDLTLADADTLVSENHLMPIFSVPLVLKHVPIAFSVPLVLKQVPIADPALDLGSAHLLQKAEHTHLFMSAKSSASFQCHKCKLTFWGDRFRCTRDVMTVVCPYVLCPGCHKEHKALAKSAQSIKSAASPAKSPKEGKVAAVTALAPSDGVVRAAIIPIMSAVIHTPTTPTSANGAGAPKRKNLSPSANGPPVAEDKILKTSESVAGALEKSSKLSQNPTLTQISGQKNKKQ